MVVVVVVVVVPLVMVADFDVGTSSPGCEEALSTGRGRGSIRSASLKLGAFALLGYKSLRWAPATMANVENSSPCVFNRYYVESMYIFPGILRPC